MNLTNTKVNNAKATGKTYRLTDGRGLYLEVSPTGCKWWRYKYRIDGKEKRFALGAFPDVNLKEARERHLEARKLVEQDIDPVENKRASKASRAEDVKNAFEVIAREWHVKNITRWTDQHGIAVMQRFEKDLFPYIGSKPISKISNHELLKILNKIQERGAEETAHRLLQYCSKVCRYAIVSERLDRDFTVGLKEALKPVSKRHLAAITDPEELAELLKSTEDYEGHSITKLALKFAPLVFVRPGEMRKAEWSEIDFENADWNIPAEKMKMKEPHLVPLSKQAIEILKELQPLSGHCKYVFPSSVTRTRPMSNNTINMALRRLGYTKDQMTAHGFRATARTILDEVLNERIEYIEQQLAHAVKDANGRAYNRTKHLQQRRVMMQKWADYLDGLKVGGKVIPLKGRVA
ncbi:MAG: integrase arm-type DNA-binding domain-containing protein [Deltaproteobacteria bacterium]|nr:integrase arm-type DNA-binding domain-containing protein [Deltaproteobacteria bacterium]